MVHAASYMSEGYVDLRAPSLTTVRRGIKIDSLRVSSLIIADCVLLLSSWQIIRKLSSIDSYLWSTQQDFLILLFILALHIWFILAHGLYGADIKRRNYGNLIKALGLSHISLLLLITLVQPVNLTYAVTLAISWGLCSAFLVAGRWSINQAIAYVRQTGKARYPSIVICNTNTRNQSIQLLQNQSRYQIKGWVDASVVTSGDGWDTTLEHIKQLGISEVFLCSAVPIHSPLFLYWSLRNAGITLHILPQNIKVPIRRFEGFKSNQFPGLTFAPPLITGSDFWIKRSFDFCAALGLLLLLSPILITIALFIKLDSPGSIFFKQTRMGLKNQEFKAWKFRTMVANAEQLQKKLESQNETNDGVLFKIKDDPRITRVGKFLRQYSLDELPQLFNVLFGEMSLVGPRPLPMRDIEKFEKHHFIRHEVLPGITGLWQVSGRSDIIDFEQVVHLDTNYIESWSLWLDLSILFKTVKVVLQKTGAY